MVYLVQVFGFLILMGLLEVFSLLHRLGGQKVLIRITQVVLLRIILLQVFLVLLQAFFI